MSTNCVTTRSKNATQRPGLLIPKQTHRTSDEVVAIHEAKEDAKKEKEHTKTVGIKRVANFERDQADKDAMEQTPQVVTKPRPLVRTRRYADVLRSSDIEMGDGTVEPDSPFELADVESGETTDDGMATPVQDLPLKKRKKVNTKKDGMAPKVRVRDAIKAVQDSIPEKNRKHIETSDSESMEVDVTPKPCKNPELIQKAPESDVDLPAPRKRAVRPASMDEEDEEDLAPKRKSAKKDKGKGKEVQEPVNKGKATNKGADQARGDRNIPKPKSDRTSNGKEKFSTSINHWPATIPDNAKPGNKVASASASRSKLSNRSGSQLPALTNATSRSSSASVLSKSIKISQNIDAKVKTEPHDTSIEIIEIGLEDDDETMGVEREAALKSPPKGKARISSAGLVKQSPSKATAVHAPERLPKKASNNDLPEGTDQRLWRRSFVSTYMQFAASQPDPWDIPVALACEKLQLIWDAIFPSISCTVTATSPVYLLVLQRLADSWRSSIGSTALSVLVAYFESQDDLKDSDENCAEFADFALDKLRFCYKKADGDDDEDFRGLYQGTFIVQTLGEHFSAIDGAQKIPGVYDPKSKPCGTLALSIAAVERALTLWATSTITIEMVRTAKSRNISLPKKLNQSTGKISNRQTGFNDSSWGRSTRAYVQGINTNLSSKNFDIIIHRAMTFARKSRRPEDKTETSTGDAIELDRRALLKDKPCSDDEEYDAADEDED